MPPEFYLINPVFFAIPVIMFIAGLFIGRWNGGGRPSWLKWLDNPFSQALYAYPYIAIAIFTIPDIVNYENQWLAVWHKRPEGK